MQADQAKNNLFGNKGQDYPGVLVAEAGAGQFGNYKNVSFSSKGIGRFEPMEGANPAVGVIGETEAIQEERIEMICQKNKLKGVISKIKEAHPYEEPVFDIYPLLKI